MKSIITLLFLLVATIGKAQEADPTVTFMTKPDENGHREEIVMKSEGEQSADAPLDITCKANISLPEGYSYKLEWRIFAEAEGENKPLLTRFEDDMTYTLKRDGTMVIRLLVTFTSADGIETEDKKEMRITIAGSKLTVMDGLSPNGDDINDKLVINCASIVKCSGCIFNRWGQRLYTFTAENLAQGWDGMVNGTPVKDGVYFINLDAYGADGTHYKIKKAINVLKGFREGSESGGVND